MLGVLYFLFLFIACSEGESVSCDGNLVNITDGPICGTQQTTTNENVPFWAFLGIPYATPPVGDLRFRPPQPVKPWTEVRNATYERSACMQPFVKDISEDCLFLNVFTTVPPGNTSRLLPVMVNIHGGGFYLGSGNIGIHGADRLIEKDVVVVTLNYRLGVFGFLCTLDAASPGNYAIKDMIAALKWVQKNIASFGGDPEKVTIFGQSAGSSSILFLLQTAQSQGLYRGAIAQSGSSLNPWSPAGNPRFLAFRVGATNLILTLNSVDLVNRLRKVNANNLLVSSIGQFQDVIDNQNGLPWAPCLENNRSDAVVISYSYPILRNGRFNKVPILTGFNSLEARDSNRLQWLSTLYSIEFELFPSRLVPKDMNAIDKNAAGRKIKQFYFGNQQVTNGTNFVKYQSDNLFVRGINKHVGLMSQYVPVFYYRFAFTGGSQHRNFTPEGASHGEQLQFIFNTNQTTSEAKRTTERIVTLWTNFAKYQNPTYNTNPVLSNITWPPARNEDGSLNYLNIDTDLTVGRNPEEEQMTFWDNLYNQYGFSPYNSY